MAQAQAHQPVPEKDQVEGNSQPNKYAQIPEEVDTKRKNSVRRYIAIPYQVIKGAQQEEQQSVKDAVANVVSTKP